MNNFVKLAEEYHSGETNFPALYHFIRPPQEGKAKRTYITEVECAFYKTKALHCHPFHKHISKLF